MIRQLRLPSSLTAALLMLAILVAGTSARAAGDIPPAVVAVLDYQAIVRNSSAGQKVREQIEAYRSAFHQEIAGEEQRLKQ